MAIDLNSIKSGSQVQAPIFVLYGVDGVGKTTFGANAPSPILIPTENGVGKLDVPRFFDDNPGKVALSYGEVMEALTALEGGGHEFRTVIIDSFDWFERLVWQHTCEVQTPAWASIEAPGYGKGYVEAMTYWGFFFDKLQALRDAGIAIVLLGHSEVKRFEDPSNEPYDRYQIKLQKAAAAKIAEFADILGFANYRVHTTQSDAGFNNKKTRAIGAGERLLFLEERPAFHAKNRYQMPAEMPLDWNTVAAAIPYYTPQASAAPAAPAAT